MLKFLIFFIAALGFAYYAHNTFYDAFVNTPESELRACTMDAKLCPDGSAVGRTGPDCTFPACPGE